MIEIDRKKCTECGTCVHICIRNTFRFKDGTLVTKGDDKCVECMHCAIACPQGAINVNGRKNTGIKPAFIESEEFSSALRDLYMSRRSYRYFAEEQVPTEIVMETLNLTAWAASTKNEHPVGFYVLEGKNEIDTLMGCVLSYLDATGKSPEIRYNLNHNGLNSVTGTAKTLVLAYADSGLNPHTDCVIAMEQAELMLQSRGIGTCWAGYLVNFMNEIPKLREHFNVPEERTFYAALMIGYPTENFLEIPDRALPNIEYFG